MNKLQSLTGLLVAILLAMTSVGCGNSEAQKAAGVGLVEVGTVIARLPSPVAKVVGVTLISAGTVLIVYAEMRDGSTKQFERKVTDQEKKTLDAGESVTVVDPSGNSAKFKLLKK